MEKNLLMIVLMIVALSMNIYAQNEPKKDLCVISSNKEIIIKNGGITVIRNMDIDGKKRSDTFIANNYMENLKSKKIAKYFWKRKNVVKIGEDKRFNLNIFEVKGETFATVHLTSEKVGEQRTIITALFTSWVDELRAEIIEKSGYTPESPKYVLQSPYCNSKYLRRKNSFTGIFCYNLSKVKIDGETLSEYYALKEFMLEATAASINENN
jgi:hypothetical protein